MILVSVVASLTAIGTAVVFARRRRARRLRLRSALEIPGEGRESSDGDDVTGWIETWKLRRDGDQRPHGGGSVGDLMERARIPLRAGEALAVAAVASGAGGALTYVASGSLTAGILVVALLPGLMHLWVASFISRRRRALREQLPEALAMLSSSMRSGHSFHRSMESLAYSGQPPLSEEFAQVLAETRLGVSVIVAVENMAERMELPEGVWMARAVTIHYGVGGRLADLLQTLSELTYARHELQREIAALTAEGRMSTWVLGLLPVALTVAIHLTNPAYLAPMTSGFGLIVSAASALSVVVGVVIIRNMVRLDT